MASTLTQLRSHRAMDEARAYVRDEADRSRALLDSLPQIPARLALAELCDTVVTRLG